MLPFILLVISFIVANLMHGGLIYHQRHDPKATISQHAAHTNRTYALYIVGHILAATAFYLFARQFFAGTSQATILVASAQIGYVADIIQAFIPARGKAEDYHAFFAYIMAYATITISVVAAFSLPLSWLASVVAKAIAICLVISMPLSQVIPEQHFYKLQLTSLTLFYLQLFVIVLS